MSKSSDNLIGTCIQLVLRPGIQFCLKRSIKIQEILETCKILLIEAAEQELESQGKGVSTSRLSVMTGIHRKDIVRLRTTERAPKKGANMVTRIMGQWRQSDRFRTASGKPRALEYEGMESEFAELVRSVSRELNPYTVLFELERVAAVKRSRGKVTLQARTFMPREDTVEGFRLLSNDSEDLLRSVTENIEQDLEVPNLHIKTEYDNIPASKAEEIREWVLKTGSAFQERMRNYLSQFDRDINPDVNDDSPPIRVAVGTFSYIETEVSNLENDNEKSANE